MATARMIDDALAESLPRFVELSRARLARTMELATRRDIDAASAIVCELHSIACDASSLGLTALVARARTCEDRARTMGATHDERDAAALLDSLRKLDRAVELFHTRRTLV